LFFTAAAVYSETYYVATDGLDSNPGTHDLPWETFEHTFSTMSGGDTIVIKDGSYDQQIISYYGSGIPVGTEETYTLIKAENDWGVEVSQELRLSPASFIHIQGIHFLSGGFIAGSHHIKIIRCSFRGNHCTDNTTVISAGTGCSYILFEECFSYGCGRYKFMGYGDQGVATEKIIFRRCVSRHDYHEPEPGWGRQCATFTSYDCHDFLMQNCISINSGDNDPSLYGYLYGGTWFENKGTTPADNSGSVQGCIFLDIAGAAAINDPLNDGSRIVENCVFWDSKGGYLAGVRSGNPTLSINHLTIGNIWGDFQDRSYAWGTGVYTGDGFASSEFKNSIIINCNSYGIADHVNSDYNDYYENTDNFGNTWGTTPPFAGPNDRFVDPELKYICRIEEDSPLKGVASDGGDIGANVLYRYGVSGTLWGEDGYDSLTKESLWPFPNEDIIKEKMSSWAGPNDGERGFCANDTGLYGGPITLTSYIWEYLGNPCPSEFIDTSNITDNVPDSINIHVAPNPFRRNTMIEFNLAAPAEVTIEILNILGAKIRTIDLGKIQENPYSYELDMSGDSQGIYFLKIQTNTSQQTIKIELFK
jgi:hypothetical protein